MKKTIIVAALESEYFVEDGLMQNLYYTGIGKINSSRMVTQLILQQKPQLIINLGTAGCLQEELLGGVFAIRDVVERDMMAEPLSPRGEVPFSEQPTIYTSSFGHLRCGTGDSFVTVQDEWLFENNINLVDMELFAIAKICHHYGVEWRSIKFASDMANEEAGKHWNESVRMTKTKIGEALQSALDF